MAYSDYGGYAYRNGERVEDRSDAVITPDDTNIGAPGIYPGFVAVAAGMEPNAFHALRDESVDGHVVLGDGPLYAALYKQSSLTVSVREGDAFRSLDLLEIGVDLPDAARGEYEGKPYFDTWELKDVGQPCRFEFGGSTIEAVWEVTDNHYQYVRLTQPDGTVWTGFSGYGVGAGLEDCGYGYSTDECEHRLHELFPAQGGVTEGRDGEAGSGSGEAASSTRSAQADAPEPFQTPEIPEAS